VPHCQIKASKIIEGHRVILDVVSPISPVCESRVHRPAAGVSEVSPILIGKRQNVPCLASVGRIQGARIEKGRNGCDRLFCLPVSFQGERFGKPWIWICLSCQQANSRHHYSHYSITAITVERYALPQLIDPPVVLGK
jgi:hypothetical protein